MTTISIIGSGNMATAIGTRAVKHGHPLPGHDIRAEAHTAEQL